MNEESGKRAVRRGHTDSSGVAARSGGGLVSGQAEGREGFFVLCWASGLVRAIELVGQTGHTLTRLRNVARGKMETSVQQGTNPRESLKVAKKKTIK